MQEKKPTEKTKSFEAYETIRKMIISGEFHESHGWSLRKLAQAFSMSVVPISEAVRRLEQEGILIAHPQRGISQRRLSPHEVKQAYIVREGLEVQAARLLAIRKSAKLFEQLEKTAERIGQWVRKEKFSHAAFEDFKFHQQLVDFSKCDMLRALHDQVITICMVCTNAWDISYFTNETNDRQSHKELVHAIGQGDPDEAERAIRRHIKSDASAQPNELANEKRVPYE